jgi:tetratricopeptide (TPR) repeat protein
MNKWRIAGLSVLVVVAGWLAWRSFTPAEPPPAPSPPMPPREVFHASKPLHVVVDGAPGPNEWLEHELRFVLARGKMRIAPTGSGSAKAAFTLRVELPAELSNTQKSPASTSARLSLIAPDGVTERQVDAPLESKDRLTTMQSLVSYLPKFLGAATASSAATAQDWGALVGTADAEAYEGFLVGSSALLDSTARGFTQPTHDRSLARGVERLEALTRKFPTFARAQGLLAIAYLGLGGTDQASLTQIADGTAKRALALDDQLADAHSAMGLARMRRGEWIPARERFEAALAIDVNSVPALEGLACLLTETGQMAAALPVAEHALLMQPANIGARECLAYARLASSNPAMDSSKDIAVVRVTALAAILSGDLASAEHALTAATGSDNSWLQPLVRAVNDKKAIPEALRAITLAASDGQIDATTEVLCGAALRQSDFVFNRMSRLQKQNQAVPLRILWLPQTAFLRQNRRFEQLVTAVDLGSYWQEQGRADLCESEPQVYGCNLRPSAGNQKATVRSRN